MKRFWRGHVSEVQVIIILSEVHPHSLLLYVYVLEAKGKRNKETNRKADLLRERKVKT